MNRVLQAMTLIAAGAVTALSGSASAQGEGADVDTMPEGELRAVAEAEPEIDPFSYASPYVRYRRGERRLIETAKDPCIPYYGKGGKIAGTVLGPILLVAGASVLAVGIDNTDTFDTRTTQGKAEIAMGSIAIAGGLAALLSAPYGLKKRNQQRRAQRLAGCPAY